MSHQDKTPTILYIEGWENLPNGRQQLLIQCNSIVDYATMPKGLLFGEMSLFKDGWDSEKKIAFFRPGPLENS